MTNKNEKLKQTEKFLRQNQHSQAIKLLREIYEKSPEEESILLRLAWAYYDSGDVQNAVECFHRLFESELQRNIFTGFAYDELVRIYKQEKNFFRLVEVCQKAVECQPEDINLLTELANAYLQTGRAKEACTVCEKMVKMEDDNSAIYCLWGEALLAAGLISECEEAYFRAGQVDPERQIYYLYKLAALFYQTQNNKEAIRVIKKCITTEPNNPLYHCFLGDCLIGLGQKEEAYQAYDNAVQCGDDKDEAAYYNRLGNSLMRAKYFSEAATSFRRALEKEKIPVYYVGLISAYEAMGLEDEAQEIIRQAQKTKKS